MRSAVLWLNTIKRMTATFLYVTSLRNNSAKRKAILDKQKSIFKSSLKERWLLSFRPAASQGANESFGMMGGHNDAHDDSYGNSSQDSTLMMREVSRPSVLTFDPRTVGSLTPHKLFRRSFTSSACLAASCFCSGLCVRAWITHTEGRHDRSSCVY